MPKLCFKSDITKSLKSLKLKKFPALKPGTKQFYISKRKLTLRLNYKLEVRIIEPQSRYYHLKKMKTFWKVRLQSSHPLPWISHLS